MHAQRDESDSLDGRGLYPYAPSLAAAVGTLLVFIVLFGVSTGQYVWYRSWFWWPMLLAILMEVTGYLFRILSIRSHHERTPFIVQSVLILVAPAVMAASCYMAFGRIVLWVVPARFKSFRHLWIPVRWLTPFFVGFDVLGFLVQVAGATMLASAEDPDGLDQGRRIVLLGIMVQLVMFAFFAVATLRLWLLLRGKLAGEKLPTETEWRIFLKIILVTSVAILLRSLYRFLEYVLGSDNALLSNEIYHYSMDAFPIIAVASLFVAYHPAQYLPYIKLRRKQLDFACNKDLSIFPSRRRVTRRSQPTRSLKD